MADQPAPRAVKLNQVNLRPAEAMRNVYFAFVEEHVNVEDMLKPIFWTHCAAGLQIGARVEIAPRSWAWLAEFVVTAVGPNWARVVLRRLDKLEADDVPLGALDEYYVDYGGPTAMHRVRRVKDKAIVQANFQSKALAYDHIKEIQKATK